MSDPGHCKRPRTHLGDGAYVELTEDRLLRVYTSDGIEDTNEVYLGSYEWANLVRFVEQLRGQTGGM